MHFRLRGNNVQVVKTVTDKKTLSSKSVPAGSANIKTGVLSDELQAALNDKEIQEVRRYIENRQRINKLQMEVDAHLLEERITEATKWMKDAPPATAKETVNQVLRAMAVYRRTANKLGLAKETKGPAKPA